MGLPPSYAFNSALLRVALLRWFDLRGHWCVRLLLLRVSVQSAEGYTRLSEGCMKTGETEVEKEGQEDRNIQRDEHGIAGRL